MLTLTTAPVQEHLERQRRLGSANQAAAGPAGIDSERGISSLLPPHMRLPHPEPQPAAPAVAAEPRQRSHSQPRSDNWLPAPPSLAPLPIKRQISPPLARGREPAPASVFGPMRRSEQLAGSTKGATDGRKEPQHGWPSHALGQPAPTLGPGRMRRSDLLLDSMKGAVTELGEGASGSRRTDLQPAPVDGAADQSKLAREHDEANLRAGRSAATASGQAGNHGPDHSAAAPVVTDARRWSDSGRTVPRVAEDSLRSTLRRYSPRSRSRSPRAAAPPEQRIGASEAGARGRPGAGRSPRRRSPAHRSRCGGCCVCPPPQHSDHHLAHG